METIVNIEEAHKQHLDVFFHASEGSRTAHTAAMRATGHLVIPFQELVSGFNMLCTAVGPRPKMGETAKTVKNMQQFIQGE